MLFHTLLLALSAFVWGQIEDLDFQDVIFSDMDSDFAPRRVPRQVKASTTTESKPHIQELLVKTMVLSRYAFTAVSCSMYNRHSVAAEAVFQFPVPVGAFISNFTMIIGGRVYPSEVRPKERKVKQEKKDPKAQPGVQARQSEGGLEVFRVAVSVPGKNRAVFLLAYEELLQRRLGRYELVTSLRPLQLVSKLSVDITIAERSHITHLEVPPLRNGKATSGIATKASQKGMTTLPISTVIKQEKNICKITFHPTIVQQARIATNGILGDFIIRYDVERELGIGDVQVSNGHFVHYFAPKDLPVVPKNVVFVIDTSASMIGTKIKQTKEALLTILKDLRPNDRFNFVSFSNRIRVWQPGQLVPVTPNSVRDAKKFIIMITPSGGTDINEAIQTGSSLLTNHLSGVGANHKSVSLIVFLTDGRPTVGEIQPPRILGRAKVAADEQLCIFAIGVGDDVDYRLLERLSLENCGTVRRIHKEADVAAMLKGFYDEIGTPLLSDIRVAYSEDSVEYVTQHSFTNYFNGSEIVIAGKLTNRSAESLHVQVMASSSERNIVLETDVELREQERETESRAKAANAGPAGEDFVERLWGFLSVKDGLRSSMQSQGSREREEITQQATNLSLAYNFLTPLTSMVVEKPGEGLDQTERGTATPDPPEETDSEKPLSLQRKTQLSGKPVKKPLKKSFIVSKTSADGDPHFVVELPLSKLTVCFNINGEPGHVLRLVSDLKRSGVTVNGKLIGAPAPIGSHKRQRTYFSTITVVVDRPRRAYIEITPHKVILDGQDRFVLPCDTTVAVESNGLAVAIAGRSNITVTVQGTIGFVILVHQYKNPAPYQRDHLGFYISNSKGLSRDSHGLLGQFLYQEVGLTLNTTQSPVPTNSTLSHDHANPLSPDPVNTTLSPVPSLTPPTGPSGTLKIKNRTVSVVKKTRKIYSGRHSVDCWFVRNNAAKLIDGQYEDYVVSHLFDTEDRHYGTNKD